MWRSVERICRFKVANRTGETLLVRRRLAPLTARQVERLPDHLRPVHDAWLAHELSRAQRLKAASAAGAPGAVSGAGRPEPGWGGHRLAS
ncbi:MAG: hypothetical protein ACK5RL_17940 [Acidimicrobiales bacterium]